MVSYNLSLSNIVFKDGLVDSDNKESQISPSFVQKANPKNVSLTLDICDWKVGNKYITTGNGGNWQRDQLGQFMLQF